MIDLIQNNEQWSTTREKLNEVIATVNVLAGEYTAKPVFSSISASFEPKTNEITVIIGFANAGNWPFRQLAVEVCTDKFVSGDFTRFYADEEDIVSGTPMSGSVELTKSFDKPVDAVNIYCRAVWAGMVVSAVVLAAVSAS